MGLARSHNLSAASTRVMLVEDSAVVRGMVRKWLEDLDGVEVVAAAPNGQAALDQVSAARPDIIILDIEMPIMDGVTALPGLLRRAPKAKVLMASTLTTRNAQVTLKAMSLGAADYLAKPSFAREGNAARDQFRAELVHKIQGLAPHPVHSSQPHAAAPTTQRWMPVPSGSASFTFRKPSAVHPRVLAIGSSTGGPQALTELFARLSGRLTDVPVVVAQHMPATFTRLLADKLARLAGLQGGEAEDGQTLLPGHLYLAPGGQHMRLKRRGLDVQVALDNGPAINHCRPAVDPLFDSVADIYGSATLGVVLTGMGSDGAQGAVHIADRGGTILVQDEASSVVWGMPGATAAAGAAAEIISLGRLDARILHFLSVRKQK